MTISREQAASMLPDIPLNSYTVNLVGESKLPGKTLTEGKELEMKNQRNEIMDKFSLEKKWGQTYVSEQFDLKDDSYVVAGDEKNLYLLRLTDNGFEEIGREKLYGMISSEIEVEKGIFGDRFLKFETKRNISPISRNVSLKERAMCIPLTLMTGGGVQIYQNSARVSPDKITTTYREKL